MMSNSSVVFFQYIYPKSHEFKTYIDLSLTTYIFIGDKMVKNWIDKKIDVSYVPNWNGIDVGIVYCPEGAKGFSFGGANPAFVGWLREDPYNVHVMFSPMPMSKNEIVRANGYNVINITIMDEPPENVKELILSREDIRKEVLGYLYNPSDTKSVISEKKFEERSEGWKTLFEITEDEVGAYSS